MTASGLGSAVGCATEDCCWGSGFFACSALNPGGGYDWDEDDDVLCSVAYPRCGKRIARAETCAGIPLPLNNRPFAAAREAGPSALARERTISGEKKMIVQISQFGRVIFSKRSQNAYLPVKAGLKALVWRTSRADRMVADICGKCWEGGKGTSPENRADGNDGWRSSGSNKYTGTRKLQVKEAQYLEYQSGLDNAMIRIVEDDLKDVL